jgi:hypothetical protein
MRIQELLQLLNSKNIELFNFEVDFICPTIEFIEHKEIVTEFTMKFSKIKDEDE